MRSGKAAKTSPKELSPISACDFTDRRSTNVLLNFSEGTSDQRTKPTPTSASKYLSPWNNAEKSHRNSTLFIRTKASSSPELSSEIFFSGSYSHVHTSQTERCEHESALSTYQQSTIASRARSVKEPTYSKSNSVPSQPCGRRRSYVFRHIVDVGDYISDYNRQCCVKNKARKVKTVPVLNVKIPGLLSPHSAMDSQSSNEGRDSASGAERDERPDGVDVPLSMATTQGARTRTRAADHESATTHGPTQDTTFESLPQPSSGPSSAPARAKPSTHRQPRGLTETGSISRNRVSNNDIVAPSTMYSTLTEKIVVPSKTRTGKRCRRKGAREPVTLKYTNKNVAAEALEKTQGLTTSYTDFSFFKMSPAFRFKDNTVDSEIATNSTVPNSQSNTRAIMSDTAVGSKDELPLSKTRVGFPEMTPKRLKEEQARIELTFHGGRYNANFRFTQQDVRDRKKTSLEKLSLEVCDHPSKAEKLAQTFKDAAPSACSGDDSTLYQTGINWKTLLTSKPYTEQPSFRLQVVSVDGPFGDTKSEERKAVIFPSKGISEDGDFVRTKPYEQGTLKFPSLSGGQLHVMRKFPAGPMGSQGITRGFKPGSVHKKPIHSVFRVDI